MPADASIYGAIQPARPTNRLADLAQAMQVQGLAGQNELAQYSLKKAQRSDEETNALAALLKTPGFDLSTAEGQRQAYGVAPTVAPSYIKTNTDARTAEAKLRETNLAAATKAVEQHRAALPNDPQGAVQWLTAAYQNPDLKPLTSTLPLDQAIARVPTDPQGFQNWRNQMALGMTKFVELNKPHVTTQDLGGTSRIVATPGLGGAPQVLSDTPITQSENNKATVAASRDNAAATREMAKATRDAAQIQSNLNTELKMADDYRAQSKNFKEVGDAYRQINGTLDKATTSPAATLAAATKFMKLLDPGSVVRESELGMALAATGVFDRATNYMQTLQSGKVLTPSQVKDFKNITQQIYAAAQAGQKQIDKNYTDQATRAGLRPSMIVQDLGQNTASPVDLSTLPTGKGGGKVVNFGDLK